MNLAINALLAVSLAANLFLAVARAPQSDARALAAAQPLPRPRVGTAAPASSPRSSTPTAVELCVQETSFLERRIASIEKGLFLESAPSHQFDPRAPRDLEREHEVRRELKLPEGVEVSCTPAACALSSESSGIDLYPIRQTWFENPWFQANYRQVELGRRSLAMTFVDRDEVAGSEVLEQVIRRLVDSGAITTCAGRAPPEGSLKARMTIEADWTLTNESGENRIGFQTFGSLAGTRFASCLEEALSEASRSTSIPPKITPWLWEEVPLWPPPVLDPR